MKKYRIRNVDPSKDRHIVVEYNARINDECESACCKKKGCEEYKEKWRGEENAERIWNLMLDTLKDERNIAIIIESENGTAIGYFWAKMNEIRPSCLCMELWDIYIEERYRKQGIASDLVIYAEDTPSKLATSFTFLCCSKNDCNIIAFLSILTLS